MYRLFIYLVTVLVFTISLQEIAYASVTFDGTQRFQAAPDGVSHPRNNGVYAVSGGAFDGLFVAVLGFNGKRTDSFTVTEANYDLFTRNLFKRHHENIVGFVRASDVDRGALTFTASETLDTLTFEAGEYTTYGVVFDAPLRGKVNLFNQKGRSKSTLGTRVLGTLEGNLIASAVPEPTTWILMIVGLAVSAIALRRRRRSSIFFH